MNRAKRLNHKRKRGFSIIKKTGKSFRLTSVDEDKSDIRAANRARKGEFITLEQFKAEMDLLD